MSDTPKVVGLDGKAVAPPPLDGNCAAVVSVFEALIAQAKAGQIDSATVVYTSPDPDDPDYKLDKSSYAGSKLKLLGALSRALYAVNRSLDETDTGEIGTGPL